MTLCTLLATHAAQAQLTRSNWRPRRPTYAQALSAFSDVLRVTGTALAQMLPPGTFHPVAYCLGRLAREFKHKFDQFNVAAPGRRSGY